MSLEFEFLLPGMGCLRSTDIQEMNAIQLSTLNRYGQLMDLSKSYRNKEKVKVFRLVPISAYFYLCLKAFLDLTLACRISIQPALCTDLKVEGTMMDRKDEKSVDKIIIFCKPQVNWGQLLLRWRQWAARLQLPIHCHWTCGAGVLCDGSAPGQDVFFS